MPDVTSMIFPWLEHSKSHPAPVQPGSHRQMPESIGVCTPWSHGSAHADPIRPGTRTLPAVVVMSQLWHTGVDSVELQNPRLLQFGVPGQLAVSQPGPCHPGAQSHTALAALHSPCPLHGSPSSIRLRSESPQIPGAGCPPRPSVTPVTHGPLPGHPGSSHSVPQKPSKYVQTHTALFSVSALVTIVPCVEHSASQPTPAHPSSQSQFPEFAGF